jgi:hypothetical protein
MICSSKVSELEIAFHSVIIDYYTGKTKYMEIGRHGDMIAYEHIRRGSNSYEKVKIFIHLGFLVTNQNSIQEKIKCTLKAGHSCYYSFQTLLFSQLLSKNFKIKVYKTIILPVVLYDCKAW